MDQKRWAAEELADTGPRTELIQKVAHKPPPGGEHLSDANYKHIFIRIDELRRHSRRAGEIATIWSVIAAWIMLGILLLLGVRLSQALAWGNFRFPWQLAGGIDGMLRGILMFETLLLAALCIWILGMALITILDGPSQFFRQRQAAEDELRFTSIGLAVADDGFWQRIPERLRRGWVGAFAAKHHYSGIENHLFFCACYWDSLQRIVSGRPLPGWFRFNHSRQDHSALKYFYKPNTWQIVLGCSLLLLLGFYTLVISIPMMTLHGMRYIRTYARMNALCEFFIGDNQLDSEDKLLTVPRGG